VKRLQGFGCEQVGFMDNFDDCSCCWRSRIARACEGGYFAWDSPLPVDVILDPFAGSNTTGAVAESIQGRWLPQ
jgi:hypothetical protein